jgi:outer membrane protein OmpA-like peptidoglycan-associated protein
MKTKLILIIFLLIPFVKIFPQLNNYSVKYGLQGQFLIPDTEFPNSAYILSLFGRGFVKYEISTSFETEIGAGIGNLSGEDFSKQKWETDIIPIDFRINFSPFTSQFYSPYVYSGFGLLRWYVTNLPAGQANKESGWNLFIPVGGGIEFNLNDNVLLDLSVGYSFAMTDKLNNYSNNKYNDGYYYFGFGFTFVDGTGLTDEDNDGLSKNIENDIGTNPHLFDTDGDKLSDGEEKLKFNTDPLNKDSDFDELNDYEEVKIYNTDPNAKDSDGDDLTDSQEVLNFKTNPNLKDTDQDGLYDGYEVYKYLTNPKINDTDRDGLLDKEEIFTTKTDPNKKDTDDDGIPDGVEVKTFKSNPLDKNDPGEIKSKEYLKSTLDASELSFEKKLNSKEPIILEGINFILESAEINSSSEEILNKTLSALNDNKNLNVKIIGYTDNTGSDKHNLQLSLQRADKVKEWLIINGIDFRRITTEGLGSANPIADNSTESGREKNRRIEIIKTN